MTDRLKGKRAFVTAAAAGIGRACAIAFAREGATVFATGAAESLPFIRQIGAEAINYETTSVEDYVDAHTGGHGFDVIYDTVGGATLDASFKAVARFGRVVSALGWGTHALAPLSFRAGTYSGVFTLLPLLTGEGRSHHGDILREVAKLVEAGALQVRLDPRHFTLESVADAHNAIKDRSSRGKLIVDVND